MSHPYFDEAQNIHLGPKPTSGLFLFNERQHAYDFMTAIPLVPQREEISSLLRLLYPVGVTVDDNGTVSENATAAYIADEMQDYDPDINFIMTHTGVNRERALQVFLENNHNAVDAIMYITLNT